MPISAIKIRLTMVVCLSGFELYSRWVPLGFARHLKSLIVGHVFFNCDEIS